MVELDDDTDDPTSLAYTFEMVMADGPAAGQRFPIPIFPCVVGRGKDADVRLPTAGSPVTLSRRHARLTLAGGRIGLEDLSTNGTWVGTRQLAPGEIVFLEGGELIQLGTDTRLRLHRLHAHDEGRSQAPASLPPLVTARAPAAGAFELAIRALGELQVAFSDRAVPEAAWPVRKVRVLLVLLADADGRLIGASQVEKALWPDAPEGARAALQTAVSRLRRAVKTVDPALPDPVLTDRGGYRLNPLYGVHYDVKLFQADPVRHVDLYRGAFLDGHDDDWVLGRRRTLENLYLETLEERARLAEPGEAIALYARVLEHEPSRETAQIGLLDTLAAAGRRDEAMREYQTFVRHLKKTLDVGPGPELLRCYERLRGQAS